MSVSTTSNQKVELRDYQKNAIVKTLSELTKVDSVMLVAPTGAGKCLAKGTPVLMYDGTIKMVELIEIGDLLMGPDSAPKIVKSTCHGQEMMYEVIPVKGEPYAVNESHILSLRMTGNKDACYDSIGRKHFPGDIVNIDIKNYLASNKTFKHCAKGWRTGVEFPKNDTLLEFEPYFLGIWLGDGTHRRGSITTGDNEVAEYINEYSKRIDCRIRVEHNSENSLNFHLSDNRRRKYCTITNILKKYNLYKNKHIPYDYKVASRTNRLELLAGIIDSDGYYDGKSYSIAQKNEQLLDDIIFLTRSLGFAAYKSKLSKTCTNTNKKGTYYACTISGDLNLIPCKVKRRVANERQQKKNVLNVGVKVRPIGIGDYYGFELEGNDRLFLLGDFTVTHNTVLLGDISRRAMSKQPDPYPVLVLAHREELILQAQDKLFKQFGIYAGVIKSGVQTCFQLRVQVASVQTLVNRLNKTLFDPKIIIIDEAHHATAETYRKIISFFPDAKLIGLTATPYRASGEGFTDIFKSLVVTTTVKHLESIGYLIPARCFSYPLDNTKLDNVAIVKGDYDEKQIAKLMMEDQIIEDMVASYKSRAMGLKTICFAVNVEHSKKIVARFNAEGIPAAHMDANTDNRAALIKRFEKGDIMILCNVGIATEGTDIPCIRCVMIARATKSLSLFLQICGRGSRLYPDKDEYLLLDFGNCIIDHGAPNKEHDWEMHFKGIKKKGAKKEKPKEKQFKIKLETGEEFEGTRYEIPKNAKGIILEEIDEQVLYLRQRWRMYENILQDIRQRIKADGTQYSVFASIYRWQNELQKKKQPNPSLEEIERVAKVLGAGASWIDKIYRTFHPS